METIVNFCIGLGLLSVLFLSMMIPFEKEHKEDPRDELYRKYFMW